MLSTKRIHVSPTFAVALTVTLLGLALQLAALEGVSALSMHPKRPRESYGRERDPKLNILEDKEHWYEDAQSVLGSKVDSPVLAIEREAKNVIFFLGDGMSGSTITAARILKGQQDGSELGGEEAELYMDTFPYLGLSKTFCTDVQTADSACTATAYLCGTKANDATIGVAPTVKLGDGCETHMDPANQVESVLAWAQREGKSTGIVTTTRVTHASPAGTYAHTADRDWENDGFMASQGHNTEVCDDIAEQLILREPGKNIDVILGGGRREFTPNTTDDPEPPFPKGRRWDGVNLIDKWIEANPEPRNKYVTSRAGLRVVDANPSSIDKLLGLFNHDHIGYYDELEAEDDPTLEEMTRVAIKILSRNPKGFFLFVEGGRIDHAHHVTEAMRALVETIEFDKAIKAADDLTPDADTLILITADHSHTMTFAGYPRRGQDILGIAENADDGLPYSTLAYANGPGYQPNYPENNSRYDITYDDFGQPGYRYMTTVPISYETHGGDDVYILSKGPFAHLLTGVQYQSFIPHVIGYASCTAVGGHRRWDGCGQVEESSGMLLAATLTPVVSMLASLMLTLLMRL